MINNIKRSCVAWLDANRYVEDPETSEPVPIDWFRIVPLLALHLMCFAVLFVGFSWIALFVAVAFFVIRMFAITGFYHRYFSHKTFKTSRWLQLVMAIIGASAAQRGAVWWAAHHRHHHRHSDTEHDSHSPHTHGFLWSHVLWFMTARNFPTKYENVPDLMKYPELSWLDRHDFFVPVVVGFLMFGLGMLLNVLFPSLGTSGMQMLIWGFFISTVALFHCTCFINSLSHMVGKKRFETGDESRNSLILALVTLGEGWHNNHHYYPAATRQGFYWYEIDITYYVLRFMEKLGLVWGLKPVPTRILEQGRTNRKGAS